MATPQQLVQADEWSQYLMWGGQCFRPCPSITSPGPFRAFNKMREVVSPEETIWKGGMWAGVSLATDKESEAKYLVVHTKDKKYGPNGKRELWASHGRVVAGQGLMPYTPAPKPKKVTQRKANQHRGASWSRTTMIIAKWGRKAPFKPTDTFENNGAATPVTTEELEKLLWDDAKAKAQKTTPLKNQVKRARAATK